MKYTEAHRKKKKIKRWWWRRVVVLHYMKNAGSCRWIKCILCALVGHSSDCFTRFHKCFYERYRELDIWKIKKKCFVKGYINAIATDDINKQLFEMCEWFNRLNMKDCILRCGRDEFWKIIHVTSMDRG